jgi:hypothetical protein
MRTERYSPKRDHARGRVSPLQSPEHPMGHANKRARQQHHWRFGHSPRMPGHCTQRVGQHSVSGLTSRDSITYYANNRFERTALRANRLMLRNGSAASQPDR